MNGFGRTDFAVGDAVFVPDAGRRGMLRGMIVEVRDNGTAAVDVGEGILRIVSVQRLRLRHPTDEGFAAQVRRSQQRIIAQADEHFAAATAAAKAAWETQQGAEGKNRE